MVELLRENPVLLLFVVIGIGHLIGRVQIAGFGLGVAAVLFTGLAFGALDPGFKLPDIVYLFGLILFVYTIGLSSGPGFFASFRKRGVRDNLMVLFVLIVGAGLAIGYCKSQGLSSAVAAGLFAGSLTNTPALAATLDSIKVLFDPATAELLSSYPVVAYSIAYPGGVLGMLLAISFAYKNHRKRHPRPEGYQTRQVHELENLTVKITNPNAVGVPLGELRKQKKIAVSFARMKRAGVVGIATDETQLVLQDLVSIVGRAQDLHHAVEVLGQTHAERLDLDRSQIDFRRIFVSQKSITEVPISNLHLGERFQATITRIRRGDVEIIPDAETHLELGDRVRVVAPRERQAEIARYFGDSYKALSEIDVITFSLGLTLGLILGKIPVPLPGTGHFELGLAGGPLIVGLILGRLGRTGSFVWTLPYSANLTLRQLGIVLFLAGVGLKSGSSFASTLEQGGGAWILFFGGLLITLTTAALIYSVGRWVLKVPTQQLIGMMAGIQTQPAALAFAVEQTKDEVPNAGYASVYPAATILKIIFAQLILLM
jgi:putative transport protein